MGLEPGAWAWAAGPGPRLRSGLGLLARARAHSLGLIFLTRSTLRLFFPCEQLLSSPAPFCFFCLRHFVGLPSCARAGARWGGGAGGQSGKRFAETDMGQTLVTDKCVLVSMASKDILHAPYGFLTCGLVIRASISGEPFGS